MMRRGLGGQSFFLYRVSRFLVSPTHLSGLLGVVNAQLIVYDTANLRVVDASIMPTQVSAHLMSTLYGIAEKAADLIKLSWGDQVSSSDVVVQDGVGGQY